MRKVAKLSERNSAMLDDDDDTTDDLQEQMDDLDNDIDSDFYDLEGGGF